MGRWDAAPDGWGERLVAREHGDQKDAIGSILKSPNHDRTGNLPTRVASGRARRTA